MISKFLCNICSNKCRVSYVIEEIGLEPEFSARVRIYLNQLYFFDQKLISFFWALVGIHLNEIKKIGYEEGFTYDKYTRSLFVIRNSTSITYLKVDVEALGAKNLYNSVSYTGPVDSCLDILWGIDTLKFRYFRFMPVSLCLPGSFM